MNRNLELLAPVQRAISQALYYQEGNSHSFFLLNHHHPLHLSIVGKKLVDTNLILFFPDILDKALHFFGFVDGNIRIHGKQAHKGDHEFFLQLVLADIGSDNGKLQLGPHTVIFVEGVLFLEVKVVVPGVDVGDGVFEGVEAVLLGLVDFFHKGIVVHYPALCTVSKLEYLEL